jgi:phage terminase large subunit-like protein
LHAHLLLDAPGALWTRETIEAALAGPDEKPDFVRIVVAVDPPATSGENADECGMIVAGLAPDRRVYVLADLSRQGETPLGWASRAVAALKEFSADCIVAEVNNGGDMIETLIRQVDASVPYRAVRASRGKFIRAEPVAALYEQDRVRHCGVFAKLEDQMCLMTPDFDRARAGYSPDRVDALVWAVSALLFEQGEGAGVFEFYRNMAKGSGRE